jgi:ubiquitin-protein ligase
MAPPSSRFAGIILNISLTFPENYPIQGPRADLVHGLPFFHEHIYGEWICLSILNDFIPCWGETVERAEGWSYGYSVASILVQLQSFLFDEDPVDGASLLESDIDQTLRACIRHKDHTTHHSYLHPNPKPFAWKLPDHFHHYKLDENIAMVKSYFNQERMNLQNNKPITKKSVMNKKKLMVDHSPVPHPLTSSLSSSSLSSSFSSSSSLSSSTTIANSSSLFPEHEKPFLRKSNGSIECEIVNIKTVDGGAALLVPTLNQSTQDITYQMPKSELMKVNWEGSEMTMVIGYSIGDKVTVYKTKTPYTHHHHHHHHQNKNQNKPAVVSLTPPRPKTLSKSHQKQLISNLSSNLMNSFIPPGTSTVLKALPNGLLVSLGPVSSSSSSSMKNDNSIAKSGLVAFLPFQACPPSLSSSSISSSIGHVVHGKGLWIVHVSPSQGRVEVTGLDPNFIMKPLPSSSSFRKQPHYLSSISELNIKTKLNGRVIKIVTETHLNDDDDEYALVQISNDSFGKLSLRSVQQSLLESHGVVWELKQVGIVPKADLYVNIPTDNMVDDLYELELFIDDNKNTNNKEVYHKQTSSPLKTSLKSKPHILDFSNYVLFDIMSYLNSADLLILAGSGGGGANFSYGGRGGRKNNINLKKKSNNDNIVHPLFSKLADQCQARRHCLDDYSCSYLREPFTTHILGVGVVIKTHQERHAAERLERLNKQNKSDQQARLTLGEDYDYDDYYYSSSQGSQTPAAPMLSDWFGGNMVSAASAWAAQQRAFKKQVEEENLEEVEEKKEEHDENKDSIDDSLMKNLKKTNVEDVVVTYGVGYLSHEAYHIHKIRASPMHDKISGWLPLWICQRHGMKVAPHALKAAVKTMYDEYCPLLIHGHLFANPSPTSKNPSSSSSSYSPSSVRRAASLKELKTSMEGPQGLVYDAFISFVLKAMNTTVVSMLSGSQHDSEAALEGYFALYQLLINIANLHEGMVDILRNRVLKFVYDPTSRDKAHCPSLGELLPLLPLCNLSWNQVVIPIIKEAFIRNARWAIKECPALADISSLSSDHMNLVMMKGGGGSMISDQDRYRLSNTLKANKVSLRLIAFHCVAADLVVEDVGSCFIDQINNLESCLGKPSSIAIQNLQLRTRNLKSLSSWESFWNGVKLQPPSDSYLVSWLKKSIELSSNKRYHNQKQALNLLKNNKLKHKYHKEKIDELSSKDGTMMKYDHLLDDYAL